MPNGPQHGTDSTYAYYRCRCEACRRAHSEAGKRTRAIAKANAQRLAEMGSR